MSGAKDAKRKHEQDSRHRLGVQLSVLPGVVVAAAIARFDWSVSLPTTTPNLDCSECYDYDRWHRCARSTRFAKHEPPAGRGHKLLPHWRSARKLRFNATPPGSFPQKLLAPEPSER